MQAKFDLAISLVLSTWPALTVAVQNSWGGPQSSEKREWFAGAVSELIEATPDVDVDYMEEFLFQVMEDEFDTNLQDGSAEEVAAKIVGLKKLTLLGDFTVVDDMYSKWQDRQVKGGGVVRFQHVERGEDNDDTDGDSDDIAEEEDEDAEMGEDSNFTKALEERVQLEVDEDGFTKVVGKKRR